MQNMWLYEMLYSFSFIVLTSLCPLPVDSQETIGQCNSSVDSPEISAKLKQVSLSEVEESHHQPENFTLSHLWPVRFNSCAAEVEFLCSATYPIEWVEMYNKDIEVLTDTADFIRKNIWSDREILSDSSHFLNRNKNNSRYFANLGLSYKNASLCVAANYTCRSVSSPCKLTNLIAEEDKKEKTIAYHLSDKPIYDLLENNVKDDECEAIVMVSSNINLKPGWKCVSKNGNEVLFPRHRTCDSAMHCNTYFRHQRKQNCVKRLPPKQHCLGCVYMNISESILPGFIWCEKKNGKPITALHHFFSVPQRKYFGQNLILPELYLNWDEAKPDKMMYFEPIEEELYIGQNVTFTCSISRYYFAYGHRFAFEFENGTMVYSKAIDGMHDLKYNTNIMSLTLQLNDMNLKTAYFLAPIWNSTEWVNKSQILTLNGDASPPSIHLIANNKLLVVDQGNGSREVTFTLHERNQTISCVGRGKPTPEIQWKSVGKQGETQALEMNNDQSAVKILVFPYVTYMNRGKYVCIAKNFLGTDTAEVDVNIKDGMTIVLQLGATVMFALMVIFGVTLSFCYSKVQRQRKILRALTDEEIREFREGNFAAVENSAYLDNETLLHALPYNDEYEIPIRHLFIDTSVVLGSGNFGQVFKGRVVGNIGEGKFFEVAVKTAKPRFDVTYFRALLSEVKIMAYIGRHANIVSLVGACTKNIQKREIYIAVEYCAKGSLEQLLKKSRVSFVNLISNDTIYINTSTRTRSVDEDHRYENINPGKSSRPLLDEYNATNESSISTVELLKWSREIANGMEFLESKKVIHGDLAARNVLIDARSVAKIGDFGLSRQLMEYSNYVRSNGDDYELPWKWMAIEVLEERKFSPQSDVWSLGVTLWEIFSLAQTPYPGIFWSSSFVTHLREGLRLHKPPYATSHLYNLMLDCMSLDVAARPAFTELKDVFDGLLMYSCNNEYFKTDTPSFRSSSNCIHKTAKTIPVHNPSYSVIADFEPATEESSSVTFVQGTDRVQFEYRNCRFKKESEDENGYLKPLILTFDKPQQFV